MSTNYSIAEEFRLPTEGQLYTPVIDPQIRLKSMTTLHEKKLLSTLSSDAPLKVLSEIIDDCIVDKKPISSYDMIYGDFEFLLYKLRIVTFGPQYPLTVKCPHCTFSHDEELNMDDLEAFEMDSNIQDQLTVRLPRSNQVVKMKLITPRMKDEVTIRAKQLQKKSTKNEDPSILLNLEMLIDTVDNEKLTPAGLTKFVETLPMMDGKVLSKAGNNIRIGLDTSIHTKCPFCSHEFSYNFPFNGEFFNPTID